MSGDKIITAKCKNGCGQTITVEFYHNLFHRLLNSGRRYNVLKYPDVLYCESKANRIMKENNYIMGLGMEQPWHDWGE